MIDAHQAGPIAVLAFLGLGRVTAGVSGRVSARPVLDGLRGTRFP